MSGAERYGPQLDDLHEEQLKAERLTLKVDGRLVRSESNTPAGRQAIDKAALRASETSDDVRVGPMEAGGAQAGTGRLPATTVPASGAPASVRPTLAPCCKSVPVPTPSGRIQRRHAFNCLMHPGQPIGAVTAQVRDISEGRLARQHRAQTLRTGLDEAVAEHPAGGVLTANGDWCPVHESEAVLGCVTCSDRRTS